MKTVALREKDLATLRETFRRFPSVKEVRVFGSRATGNARMTSDLDLAISAPEATSREWSDLAEALEMAPLIYELDIVRPEETSNERLKEKIECEGIMVFSQNP